MSYQDIGFDQFLNLETASPAQQLDPLQSDILLQNFTGDKIQGGLIASADGKIVMDLNAGIFKVNNGVQDLIQFGILDDGSVGLLIKDNDGNPLLQVSGNSYLFSSAKGTMKIDLTNENIIIYDDANVPQAVFGKV